MCALFTSHQNAEQTRGRKLSINPLPSVPGPNTIGQKSSLSRVVPPPPRLPQHPSLGTSTVPMSAAKLQAINEKKTDNKKDDKQTDKDKDKDRPRADSSLEPVPDSHLKTPPPEERPLPQMVVFCFVLCCVVLCMCSLALTCVSVACDHESKRATTTSTTAHRPSSFACAGCCSTSHASTGASTNAESNSAVRAYVPVNLALFGTNTRFWQRQHTKTVERLERTMFGLSLFVPSFLSVLFICNQQTTSNTTTQITEKKPSARGRARSTQTTTKQSMGYGVQCVHTTTRRNKNRSLLFCFWFSFGCLFVCLLACLLVCLIV